MKTLAIIASHPIQYYAPIYRTLAGFDDLRVTVFYDRIPTPEEQGEGFDTSFQWDVDLLGGYTHRVGRAGEQEFVRGLDEHRWSAVMLHGWHDDFSRRALARTARTGTPLFVRGDSHLHAPRPFFKRVAREIACRAMLPKFSACLAVGAWNAEFYHHFGVPDHRIISSPHCVDNEFFRRQAERCRPVRRAIRRAWRAPEEAFVFLFVGKMIAEKRPGDFIETLARCRKGGTLMHGLVTGDGPLRGTLEKLSCRLAAGATFTGFLNQTEIARAYVAADCLVLPSESETWGLVVNEALACGLPCLVSDRVGCAVDMIVPGVNGMTYACGDMEALAIAMEHLATRRPAFPVDGSEWRRVVEKHSCERAASGIEQAVAGCRR